MKPIFSIVAPMYNEENLVEEYCNAVFKELKVIEKKFNLEIILVNDGSKDNTWPNMKYIKKKFPNKVSLVNLSRNFGLEGAIYAGLKVAKGEIVVVMDADLQDPPQIIIKMLEKFENGNDIVLAKRKKRLNDNFFKRESAKAYYFLLDKLSGKINLERDVANFRMLSKKAVEKLLDLKECNPVFRVTVPFIGMKSEIIEYERDKRFAGNTKYNLKSMIRYALDSLTGISIEPLRKILYFVILSILICIISFILFIIEASEFKMVYLITSIISMLTTFILISLTIIGEYIGQIFLEVKERPISIIYEYFPINIE